MQHFQATKIPVLNKYDNKINYLKRKSELSVRSFDTNRKNCIENINSNNNK